MLFSINHIADSSIHQLKNPPSLIIKNPIKIRQICHSNKIYHLSYPISSKPTKINHFSHFTTKKSNSHLIKNPHTIPKTSLFISTFTDKHFPSKILKHIIYTNLTTNISSRSHTTITSLNLTKSTQIHSKIHPMIKSLHKHKTLLFLSQNKYNP